MRSHKQIHHANAAKDASSTDQRNPAFTQKLEQLQRMYHDELRTKLKLIDSDWQLLQESWNDSAAEHLYRLVHTIAGSAATFGFAAVSDVARELTMVVKPLLESATQYNMRIAQKITALLEELHFAAGLINEPPSSDSSSSTGEETNRTIFIVDDDIAFLHQLSSQLRLFNYTVVAINHLAELPDALNRQMPAAIIMDVTFPQGELAGADLMSRLQQGREEQLPVIFVSARTDIVARLQAVRAGGIAYFPKPADVSVLLESLERLTSRTRPDPYRVLVIDDSPFMAQTYASVLEGAGTVVTTVTDPLEALKALSDFQPDIIVMDVYMPECSGGELTAVIRQQPQFVGIPIVFLSVEADRMIQRALLDEGGDDFLTKPIRPDHLVSVVLHRAARARMMRERMVRDGLTGLLNHTATEQALQTALARAQRYGSLLSVALIDIDSFKTINDTYGHGVGDTVLRNLSHLLQQRLRKSDTIGRYGGEEFVIVLPDTDASAAMLILDELRVRFEQVRHRAGNDWCFATFSGGVVSFPEYADAQALLINADAALYEAKRSGRNRIVAARPTSESLMYSSEERKYVKK